MARYLVREKLLAFRDTMEIEHDGTVVATVRKANFSPLQHRSFIDLADGSVDVAPGQNDALMLTIAICLDRIHHDQEERERR